MLSKILQMGLGKLEENKITFKIDYKKVYSVWKTEKGNWIFVKNGVSEDENRTCGT